jgi:SAM-dependent methyltransferase
MAEGSIVLANQPLHQVLHWLYERQLAARPDDHYLRDHARASVAQTQTAVFDFYARYLPSRGRVLDWGCRHAPDSCLMRARFGSGLKIDGCDVVEAGTYSVFHGYSGLHYRPLKGAVRLPYESDTFDAVVASGTLEHVPMDYESLKELYRVLRISGTLVITYLPNRLSVEEWYKRWIVGDGFHRRLYRLGGAVRMLQHAGFHARAAGFQTRLDLLPAQSVRHRILRKACWLVPLHWFTSTIGIVAEKMQSM